ncbi:MAG: hypothetical protein AB7Q27_23300 [Acidimicrobiia bacterium]
MSRTRPTARRLGVASLVTLATLTPATSAAAHGGTDTDVTSNYRTRITDPPDVAGLAVRTVDLDGSVELTWNGAGTLLVLGYENEPFLRFDDTGVSHNLNSPATYLNQDRYANIEIPDDIDGQAPPEWEPVATTRNFQWHDHRTHWMSPIAPPQVNANPDRPHKIFERWEIPLIVDNRPATIAGDLTWTPPPTTWMWLAAATAIAIGCTAALSTSRWRIAAVLLGGLGVAAMTVDTIGYVARLDDTTANTAAAFLYCFLATAATIRLAIHARRRTPDPTLAMMTVGLILAVMGGLDRVDVLSASNYDSSLPAGIARIATISSLGVGVALIVRFGAFMVKVFRDPHGTLSSKPPHNAEPEPAST